MVGGSLKIYSAYSVIAIVGCASLRDPAMPEPRPLAREYPVYRAPEDPRAAVTPAGQPVEPSGPLSLRDALALALLGSPTLASFSWEIRAAEARALRSAVYPNPELEIELEEFDGDRHGFSEAETTVSISQTFLLGGKRSHRMRVAELESELAAWEYEAKRLDVATGVERAFAAVLAAQEDVGIAEEGVRLAQRIEGAVGQRVEAGAASPVEHTQARVLRSAARAQLVRARQELHASRLRLVSMWGSSDPRFERAAGSLDRDIALPPLAALRERIAQNPEFARTAAELARRNAALDLERANRIPDFSLRAGYRRLEAEDVNTFVAAIAIPLPIFDRNRGAVREAEARVAQAELQKLTAERSLAADLSAAHGALAAALEERGAFRDEILPGALSAFERTQEGYDGGKFDYLLLLTAQQNLAKTRSDYVGVLLRLNEAEAAVERLTGEPLRAESRGKTESEGP